MGSKLEKSASLWDIYMELYLRTLDKPAAVDASYIRSLKEGSATSTAAWRQIIHWYKFNIEREMYKGNASAPGFYQDKMAANISLVLPTILRSGRLMLSQVESSVVAESIMVFWKATWDIIEKQPNQAHLKRWLILQMHEWINIPDTSSVSNVVRKSSLNCAMQQSTASHTWSIGDSLFMATLMPDHLLVLAQTFAYCYLNDNFVPPPLFSALCSTLYADASSKSAHYLHVDRCLQLESPNHMAERLANVHKFYKSIAALAEHKLKAFDWSKITPLSDYFDRFSSCMSSLHVSLLQIEERLPQLAVGAQPCETINAVSQIYASLECGSLDVSLIEERATRLGLGHWMLEGFVLNEVADSDTWCQRALDLMYRQVQAQEARLIVAANDGNQSTSTSESPDATAETPRQRIAAIRKAYFKLLELSESADSYSREELTGTMNKAIKERLELESLQTGDRREDRTVRELDIVKPWDAASVWINLAISELLGSHYGAVHAESSVKSRGRVMRWLYCGVNISSSMNAGGRAQIWIYILRLEAGVRPLTKEDFAGSTCLSSPNYRHIGGPCFMHINFVLGKMIETTTEESTLLAIDRYLAKVAWRNTDIIAR
ncbi:hypothetical protein FBU59_001546 [Linderina macrospora]|uniref:Uncharacterized protein n=1 Tax=Linderina macrospora TaxID=4868 RepID=A0ACC1JDX7_9FUNG|nr:hypothetical protein FBU59_001546 [Linderina macrospora]